jgi:hypothetical protein
MESRMKNVELNDAEVDIIECMLDICEESWHDFVCEFEKRGNLFNEDAFSSLKSKITAS